MVNSKFNVEELGIRRLPLKESKKTSKESKKTSKRLMFNDPRFRKQGSQLKKRKSYVPFTPPKSQGPSKVAQRLGTLLAGKGQAVSQKVEGRGRGRPPRTFKVRYVPGVGAVKVPTSVYKKMISQAKSQARLQEAIRKSRLATPMPGDPRMQGDPQMDAFLASEDTGESLAMQDAFARQQALEQAQGQPRGPSAIQRFAGLARRFNQRTQMRQPQQGFGFGAGGGGMVSGQPQAFNVGQPRVGGGLIREPEVRALTQSSILNSQSTIGFKG